MHIWHFPTSFLHFISRLWCFRGPLSTVICSERCICAAGNAASFVWKTDAEPGWKSVPPERKQQQINPPKRVKIIPHRSDWWQAAFWKWAALAYVQNISSTWERGDGAHICAGGVERRTQRMCLNPRHKSMSVWQTRQLSQAYWR